MLDIGEALKDCRELKQLSLGQLSVLSGVNKSYLSKIENNKRDPSISSLQAICKSLGIPLGVFILMAEKTENDDFAEIEIALKEIARNAISANI